VRLLHSLAKTHASFDDPNLVSQVGLVPVMALAARAGLGELVAEHVRPDGECGVNPHLKVPRLVAGMAAGADSIVDMDLLRHGAMNALSGGIRAPFTLGSHLRSYTWGNVSQLEKARSRASRCWSGPERAGRDHQHAAVGTGDRRYPAARRERRLRARRGQPRRPRHRHRTGVRLHRDDHRPDGLGLLQHRHDRHDPPQRNQSGPLLICGVSVLASAL